MNSPAVVRQFFKTVLQQVCHFNVDVIAGDANAAAYKVFQKIRIPRSIQFLSWRRALREATRSQHGTPIWKQTSH